MRSFTVRSSASEISDTLSRLGRKRRRVRLSAWLTVLPVITPLPVSSQRRAIVGILLQMKALGGEPAPRRANMSEKLGFHNEMAPARQALRPARRWTAAMRWAILDFRSIRR